MKKFLLFTTFLVIIFFNFNKVYSIESETFVQSIINRAAETLGSNLTKEERIKKLKVIARETVDINGIGFYSLGAHRKNLTEDQMVEYKKVFAEYFLKSFSSRLAEYSNPEIEVNSKKLLMRVTQ